MCCQEQHISDVLEYCSSVEPSNLMSISSIAPLATFFGKNVVEIDKEYKLFRNTYKVNYINDADLLWKKVEEDNSTSFSNILELKNFIQILPHSFPACEHLFSIVNDMKTDKRNRLEGESMNGLLRGRQFSSRNNACCHDIQIPAALLKYFTSDMYSYKSSTSSNTS